MAAASSSVLEALDIRMAATLPAYMMLWSWQLITTWGFLGICYWVTLPAKVRTSGNRDIWHHRWPEVDHEIIEAFGGDPHNVMVFGESGGRAKTSCIYALPLGKRLFE